MNPLERILRTSPEYVEALYRQYQQDPTSVPVSWAGFFAGWEMGLAEAQASPVQRPAVPAPLAATTAAAPTPPIVLTEAFDLPDGIDVASVHAGLRIYDVVHAFRAYGHLIADIDPLGRSSRTNPLLDLSEFGFEEGDLDQGVHCAVFEGLPGGRREGTVREFLQALRETYCASVGVEYMDVADKAQRDWLQRRMEPGRNRLQASPDERRESLRLLITADTFEESLGRMFPGAKRFSLEGGTTLVTSLQEVVDASARAGVEQIVMGMAHRGRLNVLAHVLGKPYEYILAEFEGRPLPLEVQGYGDVKYHLGYSRRVDAAGRAVEVSLEFNPSHLEIVNPVVEGIVRARQNHIGDTERVRVLPVLIHGDAAMAAQGVVAETLLLAGLKAYNTGGTVHVIVNNQVGFTTDPDEARSTRYASDIAKIAKAPVFHVNGDDAEAVRHVSRLALEFRQHFHQDVVVDLVCFRRHGHNELDDPSFTQPVMYEGVRRHASNSATYAAQLVREGIVTEADVAAMRAEVVAKLEAAHAQAKVMSAQYLGKLHGIWEGLRPAGDDWSAKTAVPKQTLDDIARAFVTVPEGFTWHPRLRKLMERRAAMVLEDGVVDWACAEALAFGSLVVEGTKVRLTGQDTQRGTFSQRHAVYHDARTGERHVPLNHVVPGQNVFQVINSPLSEEAVLGFEYGYSIADPWTLACWEAQFGDFVNGAQVVIDQLLASAEYKWGRMSGLVLLLPHGYEGQGPEHSSARLERFLELCAENNMQVCHFSTPAQYFHALRRQVRRDFRKPLIVMTPKSLLRHELAVSRIDELTSGEFKPVMDDADASDRASVRRLLLCSGKVYWALHQERLRQQQQRTVGDIAIARLEQMYPWPEQELRALVAEYPAVQRITWVQEEPQNMGAWRHLRHRLEKLLPAGCALGYAGRNSAAVPATGSFDVHRREEEDLVAAALAPVDGAPRVVVAAAADDAAPEPGDDSAPFPGDAPPEPTPFRKRAGA